MTLKGRIFDIQRFSIHDGPGIRTTVFFKGCNLHCNWCHNPESISHETQVQIFYKKCIGCGECIKACPEKAHSMKSGKRIFRRELCKKCRSCVEKCFAEALVISGKTVSAKDVILELEKDALFYKNSKGGVTFSGGEPLLQKKFLKQLLIESKKKGFHTTVDTALSVPFETIKAIRPYVDLFLIDIKGIDGKKHRENVGADNKLILENISKLADGKSHIWIRIPVIPGMNATVKEMKVVACFLKGKKGIEKVELLPFHQLAEGKYESLGMKNKAKNYHIPSEKLMIQLNKVFK